MENQERTLTGLRLQLFMVLLASFMFPCTGIGATATVTTWAKSYQGWGYAVQQTSDGGYVSAGTTSTYNTNIRNMWVLKVDGTGNVEWEKTYGDNIGGYAYSIEQTSDGGYIVGGYTVFSESRLKGTAVALRLDAEGNVLWQKSYPPTYPIVISLITSIREVPAGGYVAVITNGFDAMILRLDVNGNVTWQKKYPLKYYELPSVWVTTDGGFVVSAAATDYTSLSILKLNADGTVVWQKKVQNVGFLTDIRQTKDGGYIVSGKIVVNHPSGRNIDVCIVKLDRNGNIEWSKNYGTAASEIGLSIRQTSDDGYVVTGGSSSYLPYGEYGSVVFKLDQNGAIQWQRFYAHKYGMIQFLGVQQTVDGGYILSGFPYVVKLNADGMLGECSSINIRDYDMQSEDASIIATDVAAAVQTVNATAQELAAIVTDLNVTPRVLCEAAVDPNIAVNPGSLSFGSIEVPGSSVTQTVTISNTASNTMLAINSISITGANAGDFTQTNDCSSLAGNSSCSVTIAFMPRSVGLKIATLNIASNDPDMPAVEVPISGTGTDTAPPSTIKTMSGRAGNNDWYVSDVTVALNATDAGSGVKEIHYTIDGAGTVITGNTASFTINAEGSHGITYYAKDNANNSETSHPLIIKIDKTAPTITATVSPAANANGWHNSDVTVTFTCIDTVSGIASCSGPITVTTEGASQIITGTAVDNAGNTATTSVTLNIDKTAPSLSVSASPGLLWPPNHKMVKVTPTVSASDANPGTTVELVSVTSSEPDNGLGDGDTGNDIVINADGTISLRAERSGAGSGRVYTMTYLAVDVAGNTSTASATVTVPHDMR